MSKRKVHHALSSDARTETIELLYRKPHDIEEIAKKLKLQPVTVRHHIQALLEAGLLESYEERTGLAGRPKVYYKISKTPPIVTFPSRRYQDLSKYLINYLVKKLGKKKTSEIMAGLGLEMGKETVKFLQATNKITEWTPENVAEIFVKGYLKQMGTEPELIEKTANKVVFRTHNCLFYELSQEIPDIMCDVLHTKFHKSLFQSMGENIQNTQTSCMGHKDQSCEQVVEWTPKNKTAPKRNSKEDQP